MSTSAGVLTAQPLGIISRPLSYKLIQTIGLSSAAFLAGLTASLTILTTPSILQTLDAGLLARQWRDSVRQFFRAGATLLAVSVATGTYCAWREPNMSTQAFRAYALSALLYPASFLYSCTALYPTNQELLARAGSSESQSTVEGSRAAVEELDTSLKAFLSTTVDASAPKPEDMSVHALVNKWAWLNLGRASILGAAAVSLVWGSVNEDLSFFE